MAYYKKRKTGPKSYQRAHCKQIRKKRQIKQVRKTTIRKINGKKIPAKVKSCHFSKKARGVLSSCVEGLCRQVYTEANRLREKIREPIITNEVLLNALEQSLAKGNVRRFLNKGTKKMTRKKLVDTTYKPRKTAEKGVTLAKAVRKPRKASRVFDV